MDELILEKVPVQPYFELEDYMNFCNESRLEASALQKLQEFWEKWSKDLAAINIRKGKNSWLAMWLPRAVEDQVDLCWNQSPSQGYLAHNLAIYMCMSAMQELLPQVADGGCAPAPAMTADLIDGLREAGLTNAENTSLDRKYLVLTWYPFKGGCEICSLKEQCPKANGESYAVTLPGYERAGEED